MGWDQPPSGCLPSFPSLSQGQAPETPASSGELSSHIVKKPVGVISYFLDPGAVQPHSKKAMVASVHEDWTGYVINEFRLTKIYSFYLKDFYLTFLRHADPKWLGLQPEGFNI